MRESRSAPDVVLTDDRDRRHAIDAVLRRLVLLEDEVHFLDGDLVGERRQLVEDLPRLQARLAVERLREEQQPHGRRHLVERFAKLVLIGRGEEAPC